MARRSRNFANPGMLDSERSCSHSRSRSQLWTADGFAGYQNLMIIFLPRSWLRICEVLLESIISRMSDPTMWGPEGLGSSRVLISTIMHKQYASACNRGLQQGCLV